MSVVWRTTKGIESPLSFSSLSAYRVRMRLIGRLILIVAIAAAARRPTFGQQAPTDRPRFSSSASELVVLPVTVTDRQGRLISDLPQEQFVVFDQGRQQDVVLFSSEDVPVSIALVIDDSGSMRGKLGQVVAATLSLARWSNPQDELFAIEFNDTVRDALEGRRLEAGHPRELEAALRTLTPQGQTALYDALLMALDRLDHAMHARRVLVLMSDGGDNVSKATLDQVLAHARRSNVAIYAIGIYDADAPETNPGVLKALAAATGGERFFPKSPGPLLQSCLEIAREIRSGYTLGYIPPERDGRYHAVRVQLDRTDGRRLVVRTRPGYFAARAVTQ
jgi:Ca-activated chloride channel homolog